VAYERDSWDVALAGAAKEYHWTISVPLALGQVAVWASRRVLAGLTLVGHAIGTFMLREMELDADRYEAAVAGSDAFEPTVHRIRLLAAAREGALGLTAAEWREGRLPDDFAALVVAIAERFPPEVRAEIEASTQKGSVFDTHPPDDRRIASAKAERAPGILRLEQPARLLLGEASPMIAKVSMSLYKTAFASGRGQLRPVAELLARHDAKVADRGAIERYFGELFDLGTPFGVLTRPAPPATLADGLETLKEARETATRLRPDDSQATAARLATRERLTAALALLELPEVRIRLGDAAAAIEGELGWLAGTLGVFAAESAALASLAGAHGEVGALLGRLSREPENPQAGHLALERLGRLHVECQKLEKRLAGAPYPFEHVKGKLSIGAFVVHGLPDVSGLGSDVLDRAAAVLGRLSVLHARVMGRLAALAERIEAAAEATGA
jgi:hypothetical protein